MGNLEVDSSTLVQQAGSDCPSHADLAAVHSNGAITVPNGNPKICGPVSQSGSGSLANSNKFYGNTGGSVTNTPTQSVPVISSRQVYLRNWSTYSSQWYDLCQDGKVRQPASTGPCTGTLIGDYGPSGALAGQTFRGGWTYSATNDSYGVPQWLVGKNVQDGVYYVDGADVAGASGAGNTDINNATIIAAAQNTNCNKRGGNIQWDHNNINAPIIPNLFMLADQDLQTNSNFRAGSISGSTIISGMFVAGDQVDLETSSNGAYGAVVAADQCNPNGSQSPVTANVVKNPSLYYDPNGQAPFTDIINTTLWLEYVG
jgi:hypothetical protein